MKIKLSRNCGLALAVLAVVICASSAALAGLPESQAWDRGVIRIGILAEPKTLNPWLTSDTWTSRVLNLVFQPLYIRDPETLKLTPWLAAEPPEYDEKNLTYTVKLRPAKWSDGTPFTAHDVVFTGWLIKNFKIPRYYSKWKFLKKVVAVDDHTVKYVLKKPKASFLTRTLTTPIAQKKQWDPIAKEAKKTKKPLKTLRQAKIEHPIGTGPFKVREWHRGVYLYMTRNPHFFGQGQVISGRKLGPYIEGIIFKVIGIADAAILGLRKGTIDMYWNGIQPGYLKEIAGDKRIKLYSNKKSALYFFGFNLRRKPFDDVNFRRAVAVLIDKGFVIQRIMQGQGTPMRSLVPPGNLFWYNERVPAWGEGLSRAERIKKAYEMLTKAGYTWESPPVNAEGQVVRGSGLKLPGGKPLEEFTILTPPADYDPNRAMSGMMIQEWLREAGIPAFARPMAFGALIQKVKKRHEFDCFVLGYGKLSLDPTYLRAFFHSKGAKKGSWNMSGYKNAVFDKISIKSDNTMDREKRRDMIHKMQTMLLTDVPYIPLYNPLLVEGVRVDRFVGWVPMLGGVGNLWSFCRIRAANGGNR